MTNCSGDDLLDTLSSLNCHLGTLSSNVIKGWFDTDDKHIKSVLRFLCYLSNENYVSPLEKSEYNDISEPVDSDLCVEELMKLSPYYSAILNSGNILDDILLMQDELDVLKNENDDLDYLIQTYEDIDGKLSLDLTHNTRKDIEFSATCKKAQEVCTHLCKSLDSSNKELHQMLIKYNPDTHLINFVDLSDYGTLEDLNTFGCILVDLERTYLDRLNDQCSDDLETCKKRLFASHQMFSTQEVETKKEMELLNYLKTINVEESVTFNQVEINSEAKKLYKKKMFDALDNKCLKFAEHHLQQTKIRYVKQEPEFLENKSRDLSCILDNVTQCVSYHNLTNCLQLMEQEDLKYIKMFYSKMIQYVNDDLKSCYVRTQKMKDIIEDYRMYQEQQMHDKSALISSIGKVLHSDGHDLKSVANAVGYFKTELNHLEHDIFSTNFKNEKSKINYVGEYIEVLQNFLISASIQQVTLIPFDLQKVWLDIEKHLEVENSSVAKAIQVSQNMKKISSKSQLLIRHLWIYFMANPSKIDLLLSQAEKL